MANLNARQKAYKADLYGALALEVENTMWSPGEMGQEVERFNLDAMDVALVHRQVAQELIRRARRLS